MPQSILKFNGPTTVDFTELLGKGVRVGVIDSGICAKWYVYWCGVL